MNDRLKSLESKAWEQVNRTNGLVRTEDFNQKFAKLIIEDCINIVNKRKDAAIDASWDVDEAMTNAVWDIEEHFYEVWGKQ